MSTNHHTNNINENREARIAATRADSRGPAREFMYQLQRVMYRFATVEHGYAIRKGIARRKEQSPTNQED